MQSLTRIVGKPNFTGGFTVAPQSYELQLATLGEMKATQPHARYKVRMRPKAALAAAKSGRLLHTFGAPIAQAVATGKHQIIVATHYDKAERAVKPTVMEFEAGKEYELGLREALIALRDSPNCYIMEEVLDADKKVDVEFDLETPVLPRETAIAEKVAQSYERKMAEQAEAFKQELQSQQALFEEKLNAALAAITSAGSSKKTTRKKSKPKSKTSEVPLPPDVD